MDRGGELRDIGDPLLEHVADAARIAGQQLKQMLGLDVLLCSRPPTTRPALALPLTDGRGFWVVGFLIQSDTYSSPAGFRARSWPDGNQVATPRPAVVHHEADTFITTYAAIDPLRSDNGAVALDGFFGWPLTAVAS